MTKGINAGTHRETNTRLLKIMISLRAFWSHMNEGPQAEWDRAYLCSMAPMSAEALRGNVEAGRSHS